VTDKALGPLVFKNDFFWKFLVSNHNVYISNFISGYKPQEHMLGALHDTPFFLVISKLSSIVFLGEIKIIK
jgi:hypothetical protein